VMFRQRSRIGHVFVCARPSDLPVIGKSRS
jgi:hypothetical protein